MKTAYSIENNLEHTNHWGHFQFLDPIPSFGGFELHWLTRPYKYSMSPEDSYFRYSSCTIHK